jgi:hypothetical protein
MIEFARACYPCLDIKSQPELIVNIWNDALKNYQKNIFTPTIITLKLFIFYFILYKDKIHPTLMVNWLVISLCLCIVLYFFTARATRGKRPTVCTIGISLPFFILGLSWGIFPSLVLDGETGRELLFGVIILSLLGFFTASGFYHNPVDSFIILFSIWIASTATAVTHLDLSSALLAFFLVSSLFFFGIKRSRHLFEEKKILIQSLLEKNKENLNLNKVSMELNAQQEEIGLSAGLLLALLETIRQMSPYNNIEAEPKIRLLLKTLPSIKDEVHKSLGGHLNAHIENNFFKEDLTTVLTCIIEMLGQKVTIIGGEKTYIHLTSLATACIAKNLASLLPILDHSQPVTIFTDTEDKKLIASFVLSKRTGNEALQTINRITSSCGAADLSFEVVVDDNNDTLAQFGFDLDVFGVHQRDSSEEGTAKKLIAVIDDDTSVLELLVRKIEQSNKISAQGFSSLDDFLESKFKNLADHILVDWGVLERSKNPPGIEFCRVFSKHRSFIIMSGKPEDDIASSFKIGTSPRFLKKPFDIDRLFSEI